MMPKRKLRMPLRRSNMGYVATHRHYLNGSQKKKKKKTNYRWIHYTHLSLCPPAGRCRDLHSEPRAVLQEVLRFHHHYLVIASRSNRGTEAHGKGRASGEQGGKREWWREKHREAELLRCCDVSVSLSLIHSPLSSLFVSLFQWGAMLCS